MCPKRFISFKKREKSGWLITFWSLLVQMKAALLKSLESLRVCNSQTEACVSWCLTVQTQVRTTKMKREQNISKRHIKRESSSSWCLWTHSKLEKKKKKSYNYNRSGLNSVNKYVLKWWQSSLLQVFMHSPSGPDLDTMSSDNILEGFVTLYALSHLL